MNTEPLIEEVHPINSIKMESLGLQLSNVRQEKGYTLDYVASKLHLRKRVIELIENDEFHLLPESPVFVKGYLRAYSKLLGVSPDPLLLVYDQLYVPEKKTQRALWQNKRRPHKAVYLIRWFTFLFAVGVMVAISIWWQKNRESQAEYSNPKTITDLSLHRIDSDFKLTDLSKMQSLLTPDLQDSSIQSSSLEKEAGEKQSG